MTALSIAWRMCLCLLLLVTAAAVYRTAFITLPEIQRSAAELPAALAGAETDLVNESAAWRVTADRQATEYRAALERQVSLARTGLLAELRPVTQQAAQTLAAYQGIPEAAGPVLDAAAGAGRAVTQTLKPIQDSAEEVAELMDCDPETGLGRACLPNHLISTLQQTDATMKHISRMSNAIADATPGALILFTNFLEQAQQTNRQFTGIATDIHTWTSRTIAPQPWYKKVANASLMLGAAALKGGVF